MQSGRTARGLPWGGNGLPDFRVALLIFGLVVAE
jgi:hypothetical protein